MKKAVLNLVTCSMYFFAVATSSAIAGTAESTSGALFEPHKINLQRIVNMQVNADDDLEYSLNLDEGTGRVATNGVASKADAELVGNIAYSGDTPDGSDYSLQLDGRNGYVDLNKFDTDGGGLTLALWFKADAFPRALNDSRLISKASGVAADDHIFMLSTFLSGSDTRLRSRVRVGGRPITLVADQGNVTTGRWHHAAMTHDGVFMRLYLDGQLVGRKLARGSIDRASGIDVAAGGQPPGAGERYFDGKLDAVTISKRALLTVEVEALFNRRVTGVEPTGGGAPEPTDVQEPPEDTPEEETPTQGNDPDEQVTPTLPIIDPTSVQPSTPDTSITQSAAFPGALGWAADTTTGGRGGRVVIVDTLSNAVDSNDGVTSFREAMTEINGRRTIVFSVAGLIDYRRGRFVPESQMLLDNTDSNVTIACQTAPPPGVTLMGDGLVFRGSTNNVIMRHCRFRNSDPASFGAAENSSCIRASGTSPDSQGQVQRNFVLDQVSCMWAADDPITFVIPRVAGNRGGNIENISLSNSIVAEGDADSKHRESGLIPNRYTHSMGPGCTTSNEIRTIDRCSMARNFIAHNGRRNGQMWAVKEGELVNNIIYNPNEVAMTTKERNSTELDVVVVGNLVQLGPTSKSSVKIIDMVGNSTSGSRLKITGNYLGQYRSNNLESYNNPPGRYSRNVSTRQMSPSLNIFNMSREGSDHLRCVGASRPTRDSHDARVINEFHQQSGQVGVMGSHERDFSEYPTQAVRQDWADSDKDGMPDQWESKMGVRNPNAKDLSSIYTNIDVFINNIARCPMVSFPSASISQPAGAREVSVPYESTWDTWAGGQTFRICVNNNCSEYDNLPDSGSFPLSLPGNGEYAISMTPIGADGRQEAVSASTTVTVGR